MSKQRLSRRDTVPHSGNNRARSVSPDIRRIPCESSKSAERKSRRDMSPDRRSVENGQEKERNNSPQVKRLSIKAISYSPAIIRSKSTDRIFVKNGKEKEQDNSLQCKHLSRRDIPYSPAIIRSKSADICIPTDRGNKQERENEENSSDNASESVESTIQGPQRKHQFGFSPRLQDRNDATLKRQCNRKYKPPRKRTDRRRRHENTRKHFIRRVPAPPKVPPNTENQQSAHDIPTNPEPPEEQHPTIYMYQHDINNNSTNPPSPSPVVEGNERKKPSRLPLTTVLCSSDKGVMQTDSTKDRSGGCNNQLRSMFQSLSNGRHKSNDRKCRISSDNYDTDKSLIAKDTEHLIKEYIENIEAREQEALLQEFWALHDLWEENEETININAINYEAQNGAMERVMEVYYSSREAEEGYIRKTVGPTMNKTKLADDTIIDTSECIDDIPVTIPIVICNYGDTPVQPGILAATKDGVEMKSARDETRRVRFKDPLPIKKPVAFVIDMSDTGDKHDDNECYADMKTQQGIDINNCDESFEDTDSQLEPSVDVVNEQREVKTAVAFTINMHNEDDTMELSDKDSQPQITNKEMKLLNKSSRKQKKEGYNGSASSNVEFAQLWESCSMSTTYDPPVTYQRAVAKNASNLPLSKDMLQKKEKHHLQSNMRNRNKNEHTHQRSRSNDTTNDENIKTEPSVGKMFGQTEYITRGKSVDSRHDDTMIVPEEKAIATPQRHVTPSRGQTVSHNSDKRSVTPDVFVKRRSTTPRRSKTPSRSKSPFKVKQSNSLIDQSYTKQAFERSNARTSFSPHRVLPTILHRELSTASPRPRLNQSMLPPIQRTPTPNSAVSSSPGGQQSSNDAQRGPGTKFEMARTPFPG